MSPPGQFLVLGVTAPAPHRSLTADVVLADRRSASQIDLQTAAAAAATATMWNHQAEKTERHIFGRRRAETLLTAATAAARKGKHRCSSCKRLARVSELNMSDAIASSAAAADADNDIEATLPKRGKKKTTIYTSGCNVTDIVTDWVSRRDTPHRSPWTLVHSSTQLSVILPSCRGN